MFFYSLSSSSKFTDVSTKYNNISLSQNDLCHFRLGHPSYVKLYILRKVNWMFPIYLLILIIAVYHLAKQRRLPFISLNNLSATPFQFIHCDIWDPFHVPAVKGYWYFLIIVDYCTCFTWICLLHTKSKVIIVFPTFFSLIQNQDRVKIKHVHFDNAPKLSFFDCFCKEGIMSFHSCVDRPQ